MKKILCVLVLSLALFACQESFKSQLEKETKALTERDCPRRLDELTTLDSLVFHDDGSNDYKSYFTIDFDSSSVVAFRERVGELRSILLQGIRNSIELEQVRKHKLNIVYVYRVKDTGEHLDEICFTAKDYE